MKKHRPPKHPHPRLNFFYYHVAHTPFQIKESTSIELPVLFSKLFGRTLQSFLPAQLACREDLLRIDCPRFYKSQAWVRNTVSLRKTLVTDLCFKVKASVRIWCHMDRLLLPTDERKAHRFAFALGMARLIFCARAALVLPSFLCQLLTNRTGQFEKV